MSKRPSSQAEPDVNELAHDLVRRSTDSVEAEPPQDAIKKLMQEMGRRGGRIGGKKRAERMTPQERSDAASKAARVRWDKD